MGAEASQAIRGLCDNQQVLASHLEFRSQVAAQPAQRSIHLPANLPNAGQPFASVPQRKAPRNGSAQGLAIVIPPAGNARTRRATLQSITAQTQKPLAVVFAFPETKSSLAQAKESGWDYLFLPVRNEAAPDVCMASLHTLENRGIEPMGLVFVEAGQRLARDHVEICQAALNHCPEVGLVSFWTQRTGRDYNVRIHPCPSFPYQHRANEVSPANAIRVEALSEVQNLQKVSNQGQEAWGISNAIMTNGWVAVTLPRVLAYGPARKDAAVPVKGVSGGYDPWTRYTDIGLLLRHPISSAKAVIGILRQVATRIYHLGLEPFRPKERRGYPDG
jgi:hypothetical protein